jgi:hypothetical protein
MKGSILGLRCGSIGMMSTLEHGEDAKASKFGRERNQLMGW